MDDTTTLELDQWELLILERAMERMDLKNAHGQGLVALLGKIRKAQGRNEMDNTIRDRMLESWEWLEAE